MLLLLLATAFLLVPWAGAGEIIGGSEVKPHSRPYMAYLSIPNTSHRTTLLSAAHCLKPKARLTKEVSYISLSSDNERVKPGTKCKVTGWGRTSIAGSVSSVLREVDLEVQSDKACKDHFKKYLQQSMICLGDENGKKSTFKVSVVLGKAQGIVSYGHKYCIFPEVFTRVSNFVPWIRKQLRKFALQDLPDSPSFD
uniref:Peptidase S1 domain-containing protein n=1 Tax=Calidris pygmaea TaxID=425635 RepID=A0A8C3K1Y4_9CHAR